MENDLPVTAQLFLCCLYATFLMSVGKHTHALLLFTHKRYMNKLLKTEVNEMILRDEGWSEERDAGGGPGN